MDYKAVAQEETHYDSIVYPLALRIVAKIIAVIFHPLFIPVYVLLFTLYISPATTGLDPDQKFRLSISFSLMYVFFPLVTVLLAKGLGFLKSIQLKSQQDRIIPYIGCGVYFFWMWYVMHNQEGFPRPLTWFSLGVFFASSGGLTVNSFMKVSMHAIAMGVALTFMYLSAFQSDFAFGFYVTVALLVAGVVCTARLITNDHSPREVYVGLIIGILAQLLAFLFGR